MIFTNAVKSALTQYAVFRGRAAQAEYWFFYLFLLVAQVPFFALTMYFDQPAFAFGFIAACALPVWAVGSRRLHDTGRSGWWQRLILVPFIGGIVLIVLLGADSDGDNEHGPAPFPGTPTAAD